MPDNPPNILFILTDDQGPWALGAAGAKDARTPNLDRLADDGLRFTQFYNTGRCCPTRASLLTGLYPHQHGVFDPLACSLVLQHEVLVGDRLASLELDDRRGTWATRAGWFRLALPTRTDAAPPPAPRRAGPGGRRHRDRHRGPGAAGARPGSGSGGLALQDGSSQGRSRALSDSHWMALVTISSTSPGKTPENQILWG